MARKHSKLQARLQAAPTGATALYIRVSTEKQADEGYSLEAQQERLQAYCIAQGWTVDPAHIYVDAGLSAKSTERAAFQAMLQAAQCGQVGRIVVMKLDRLARNVKDFLALVEQLKGWNCDLVLIKEAFDTSTPNGKFALTMFAAIAELEASTITERVMTGKRQKASTGGYNGGRAMLGYDYANGQFTPNQDAHTVEQIFTLFTRGASLSAIADQLNKQGKPTAAGGKWYAGTVRYILTNGFYAGVTQWADVEATASHKPIISLAVYEAANAKFAAGHLNRK